MEAYETKIQEAVAEPQSENNVVELSSGVRLKTKRVPVLRIQAIVNQFKYPPIPEVFDAVKDRYYKNPHLPEYLEERQQIDIERTMAVIDAVAAMGTELLSKPDDVPDPQTDEWIDGLEAVGITVLRDNPVARYLAWIKFVAVVDQDDLATIARSAGLSMGVSEERVAAALQGSFPDN